MTTPSRNTELVRFAKKRGLDREFVFRRYVSEGVWKRVIASGHAKNLVVKGGFLLGTIFGLENRTSNDLDASMLSVNHSYEEVKQMFDEIFTTEIDDDVMFENWTIEYEEPTENRAMPGFSLKFDASLPGPNPQLPKKRWTQRMKMDITDGEKVVPPAYSYNIKTITNETIALVTYPMEQIIAEKMEAVLNHDYSNTRTRDFADLHDFNVLFGDTVNINLVQESINNQFELRGTDHDVEFVDDLLEVISTDVEFIQRWKTYANEQKLNYDWNEAVAASIEWFYYLGLTNILNETLVFPLGSKDDFNEIMADKNF